MLYSFCLVTLLAQKVWLYTRHTLCRILLMDLSVPAPSLKGWFYTLTWTPIHTNTPKHTHPLSVCGVQYGHSIHSSVHTQGHTVPPWMVSSDQMASKSSFISASIQLRLDPTDNPPTPSKYIWSLYLYSTFTGPIEFIHSWSALITYTSNVYHRWPIVIDGSLSSTLNIGCQGEACLTFEVLTLNYDTR